jgi:hypothetical protein
MHSGMFVEVYGKSTDTPSDFARRMESLHVRNGGNRTNCKYNFESSNTRLTFDTVPLQALSFVW